MELKISLSCKFCSESKFTPQIYILESNAAMYPVTFSHCNKNVQTYNRGEREDYFKGYNGRLYLCSYIMLPVLGISQNDH